MVVMLKQVTIAIGLVSFLLAGPAGSAEILPAWQQPAAVEETAFALGTGKGEYKAWGRDRDYRVFYPEFLPALFERTILLDRFDPNCKLVWIFTGERGGFVVTIDQHKVSLYQRFYDSPAFENRLEAKRLRHPERRKAAAEAEYTGKLGAVTVKIDHKLGLSLALNGRAVLHQECLLGVSRHQLRLIGDKGEVSGRLLKPAPESVVVRVNPEIRHQRMMGFGGITTPTAYAQLSPDGRRRWWELVCEYNLLIQREYPIGRRLNREMNNWDRVEDATPHYYGDNFPNGEISDFAYIKILRQLGGKVLFEFWALPPWVAGDAENYAEAMVSYCKVSKERIGTAPDIVGIQNEKRQTQAMWHKMTLALRRKLDEAGFESVRIHMSDSGRLTGGIERAKAFRNSKEAWAAIDYSATHMYDYQQFFTNPDAFDVRLTEWKQAAGDKPFLSTELCINNDKYQWPSYRIALTMGQLYHKNLVLADAAAICYCWTLLNVVQPSFGWTRTLMVPDRSHGFMPKSSSCQLRVFGAYSRRIREGMIRVEACTDTNDLLVSAFAGKNNRGTVVAINRSTKPRRLQVVWPGVRFTEMELVDPYHENEVRPIPSSGPGGTTEVVVEPGAIITLTNAALGRLTNDVSKHIR
ncbi:MAG: glycoside hydrolase [Planctomycetota bacterium]|jgi:O-glycosyl hydrolase